MANAFRELRLIRNFDSVRSGGIASVKLPINIRIHRLDIFYKNGNTQMTTEAVDGIFLQHRLKVGAKEIRTWYPKDLRQINASKGLPTFSGGTAESKTAVYPMFFSEPSRRTSQGEDATALAAYTKFGVNDLTLEIDIAASYSSAATTPELYARLEYDYVVPAKEPYFMFWRKGSFPIAGATQGVFNTIVRPAYYSRIHLQSEKCTKLEVKKNSQVISQFDSRDEYVNAMAFDGIEAQENVWSIIGDVTNRIGDVINIESSDSFEIFATTSAAENIGLLYEELRQISK